MRSQAEPAWISNLGLPAASNLTPTLPVGAPAMRCTSDVSIPKAPRIAIASSPRASLPTALNIVTSPPRMAVWQAKFAGAPPNERPRETDPTALRRRRGFAVWSSGQFNGHARVYRAEPCRESRGRPRPSARHGNHALYVLHRSDQGGTCFSALTPPPCTNPIMADVDQRTALVDALETQARHSRRRIHQRHQNSCMNKVLH